MNDNKQQTFLDAVRVKCGTRGGLKGVGKNTNEEDETPLQCVEYVDGESKLPQGDSII